MYDFHHQHLAKTLFFISHSRRDLCVSIQHSFSCLMYAAFIFISPRLVLRSPSSAFRFNSWNQSAILHSHLVQIRAMGFLSPREYLLLPHPVERFTPRYGADINNVIAGITVYPFTIVNARKAGKPLSCSSFCRRECYTSGILRRSSPSPFLHMLLIVSITFHISYV